ncbi:MAG: DivIVA domain-containing protein [Clostridia bacterium]|nr:DivIVA domain-containing protein [Clostridia bacterium]
MMTPSQLRQYEFKSAGRNAYKAEEVDSFFAEVLISYERMYRENSELIKRVSLLADRLEQYKKDEVDIKQAVLSAQKAADIIVRDAQAASEDAKLEAEALLAAAKGEAQIIKEDAEKQAIADSDLLMSMARDKAEEILNKAKEKAHGILIAANDSASDAMGAANRTVTSESLHYEMLKKEVAEFRASILAQYKAHIEMISKLPEMAVEEAAKVENPPISDEIDMEKIENAFDEEVVGEATENIVIDYVELTDSAVDADEIDAVNNTLDEVESVDEVVEEDVKIYNQPDTDPVDIPITKGFSVNANDVNFDGFEDIDSGKDDVVESKDISGTVSDVDEDDSSDDSIESSLSFFESIESVSTDDIEDKPKKKGLFKKWK